jgi:hypothetical protein
VYRTPDGREMVADLVNGTVLFSTPLFDAASESNALSAETAICDGNTDVPGVSVLRLKSEPEVDLFALIDTGRDAPDGEPC